MSVSTALHHFYFCRLSIFVKIGVLEVLSVSNVLPGLIWVQNVCGDYLHGRIVTKIF